MVVICSVVGLTAVTPIWSRGALPSLAAVKFFTAPRYHATSNPVCGLAMRFIVYSKSAAVSGVPSDHCRPGRRTNVHVRPSDETLHRSAARGLISELRSCITRASVMSPGCHWLFCTVLLQSMYVPSRPSSVSTCAEGAAASAGSAVPTELTAAAPTIEAGAMPSTAQAAARDHPTANRPARPVWCFTSPPPSTRRCVRHPRAPLRARVKDIAQSIAEEYKARH